MKAFLQHGTGNGPFRTEEIPVRVNHNRMLHDYAELGIFDAHVPGVGWRAIRHRLTHLGGRVKTFVRANGTDIPITIQH